MNISAGMLVAILGLIVFNLVILFVLIRIVRQDFKSHQEHFLQLAQQQFSAEQNKAALEWETRKQAVEISIRSLKEELERYRQLIHDLEKDRDTKYGNLENELKNASLATLHLQETTNHLNNILGNVKLRGQWGERMAEDIIRFAGLAEGVNYIKQKKVSQGTTKPDFTFLLPEKFKINMDVKFPLDNYVQMVNAESDLEKERYEKDFFQNVKERVREIQNREYINPADNTLDFVLLFIPNEQVYGLIHEKMPDLMDAALSQKVVMCSPFTLYAMLSVIRKAHENFRYEKDIRKIIALIEQFARLYERFKLRFDDIGKTLEKLDIQYRDVKNKNFRQLDTKIRHIEDYKKGHPAVLDHSADAAEGQMVDHNEEESVA